MDKSCILKKMSRAKLKEDIVAQIFSLQIFSLQIFSWLAVTLLPCADLKQQHLGLRHDHQLSPRTGLMAELIFSQLGAQSRG